MESTLSEFEMSEVIQASFDRVSRPAEPSTQNVRPGCHFASSDGSTRPICDLYVATAVSAKRSPAVENEGPSESDRPLLRS